MWTLCLVLITAGCGSGDDDEVAGPLPTGADDAQAYTERFLANHPAALLQASHLAITRLEPVSTGETDTCRDQVGVDCLPYFFAQESILELALDDDPDLLVDQVVLRQSGGGEIAALSAGDPPISVVVAAGEYELQLRHALAGESDAPTQTVFVRPPAASGDDPDNPDAETPIAQPRTVQLRVQKDCVRCSFAKAKLVNDDFSHLTLTGSTFDGARMTNVNFRSAKMEGASLQELTVPPLQGDDIAHNADFSEAVLTGARFSFRVLLVDRFYAIFRGAQLDTSIWELAGANEKVCSDQNFCSIFVPDFRNASLRASRFPAVRFDAPLGNPIHCTFQGADLTGADFRTNPPRKGMFLSWCRFDREPESGRITILRGANLTGATASSGLLPHSADFSDADLSGATLEGADFGSGFTQNPQPNDGADFSRANLTNARVAGARFASTNLTNAVLTGITPPTFNGFDLRFTNFSGIDFAGIDLSQADLSQSVLFTGDALANFTRAKLSDGVHGITLSGVKFPSLYAGLKGTDMSGADLRKADLHEADLEGVTLNNARLVGANLNFVNLHRATMRGAALGVQPGTEGAAASLRGAFMTDIDLSDADLRSVDLTGAHLYGAEGVTKLDRARLDSANLSGAICSGARFSGTLSDAVFNRAQLVNTVFNGATLTGAKFDETYLQGADFSNAVSVTGATLIGAAIAAAPGVWNFMEQDGTPYVVQYGATKLGALATDGSVRCPDASSGPCCPGLDLAKCLTAKLKPKDKGPFPPIPDCVPRPPRYDNCITPMPTLTPKPTRTSTPR